MEDDEEQYLPCEDDDNDFQYEAVEDEDVCDVCGLPGSCQSLPGPGRTRLLCQDCLDNLFQ